VRQRLCIWRKFTPFSRMLVVCNSSCAHKCQDITSTGSCLLRSSGISRVLYKYSSVMWVPGIALLANKGWLSSRVYKEDITLAGIACIIMREVYATMRESIYPNASSLSRGFPEASRSLLRNPKDFTCSSYGWLIGTMRTSSLLLLMHTHYALIDEYQNWALHIQITIGM